jgi:hypothetical protein
MSGKQCDDDEPCSAACLADKRQMSLPGDEYAPIRAVEVPYVQTEMQACVVCHCHVVTGNLCGGCWYGI